MFVLALILAAALSGKIVKGKCTWERYHTPSKIDPEVAQAAEQAHSEHVGQFGSEIINALVNQKSNKNIFISPLSIYSALIIAGGGAENQTLNEFRKLFNTGSDSRFNEERNILELTVFEINREYIEDVKGATNADVMDINMRETNAHKQINDYVSKKTKGMIKDLLQKLERETEMIIINTIYFKQAWLAKFNELQTRK
ncbi:MAG: hypothetical protein EZS28_046865, partial [Streblomastix strix]